MQRGLVPPTTSLALAVTLALGTVLLAPEAQGHPGGDDRPPAVAPAAP